MTIQFQPEQERVIDEAIQAGLIGRADEVVSADEWMRKFRAWAHSHPTTTPLLSDEAMSRESIYRERGL